MSLSATVLAKASSEARTCSVSAARSIGGAGGGSAALALFGLAGFAVWAPAPEARSAPAAKATRSVEETIRALMRMTFRKFRAATDAASGDRDFVAEVDVLDRVQEGDAVLARALERLAAGDQPHAAAALV